jgi:hypothetical protein
VKPYRPRRASRRWLDADCPPGVLAIFDDPACWDRYTVVYAEPVTGATPADMWLAYRAMSEHPTHPQGCGLSGELRAHEMAAYRHREWRHSARWSDLPREVQDVVRRDLTPTDVRA